MRMLLLRAAGILAFSLVAPNVSAADMTTLLADDFSGFRSGVWLGVVDAHAEYHYLPETGSARRVVGIDVPLVDPLAACLARDEPDGNGKVLAQTHDNRKERHAHPMVVRRRSACGPITRCEVRFCPQVDQGRSGVVFRYRNDRCYYFFGVEGRQGFAADGPARNGLSPAVRKDAGRERMSIGHPAHS